MKKLWTVFLSLILVMTMVVCSACSTDQLQSGSGQDDTHTSGNDGQDNTQTGGGNEQGNDPTEPQVPHTAGDPESDTLIVYFSWSSSQNTERMAEYIAEQTGGYLVEIVPEEPYEGSYNDVAYGRAQEEAEQNARPAVSQQTYDLIDLEKYDSVLVGYPIWWHTAPMVVGTFLEHYDWTGKDIYPFSQSASMDEGQFAESVQFVTDCADHATVHDGLFVRPSSTQAIDEYLTENGLVGGKQKPGESEPSDDSSQTDVNMLVVYFSATGNTGRVANLIAEATGGDIFELVPADPYTSDDLRWTDENSRVVQEYEAKQEGTLTDTRLEAVSVENWEAYEVVFIGYPIWWYDAAWPVNTFVRANDFTGKTVYTFCTSSSSGLGDSTQNLAAIAGGSGDWQDGRRFGSGASEGDVAGWLENLGVIG